MKRPLITGMEDEETKAPTNSQELEDSIEKNNPANTSLPPSFSLEEELRQADEEAIKALESTTDADPVPSSLPVEEDDNAQKIKAAMAQSEAGKLTDKDATKFGAIPTSTESIKNQNYYQDILQNYAKLKDAQAGRRDSMANIGMLSAADELSASVARGYGGQRKVDPNSYKPFYDMADQPVQDIEQGMKLGKEAASISEMEEMANPNSDVSKLYREQAYALLKKLGKNEYEGKLEEMSANQLMKLPGMKNAFSQTTVSGKTAGFGNFINTKTGEPLVYDQDSKSLIGSITKMPVKAEDMKHLATPVGYTDPVTQLRGRLTSVGMVVPGYNAPGDVYASPEQIKSMSLTDLKRSLTLVEKDTKILDESTKSFREETKNQTAIISSLKGVESLVDEAKKNANTAKALGGIVGSLFEPGKLTDEDAKRYIGSSAIVDEVANWYAMKVEGKITDDMADMILNTAIRYREALQQVVRAKALDKANTARVGFVGRGSEHLNPEVLADHYYTTATSTPIKNKQELTEKDKKALEWANDPKNKDNPKAKEILKLHGK